MIFIDSLFRFSAIGFLFLLAFLSVRDSKQWKSAPYLFLSCLTLAALFLGYSPEVLHPPQWLYVLVRFVDIPHLIFVWLFALSLFDHDFHLKFHHIIIGTLYSFPIILLRLHDFALISEPPYWLLIYGSLTSAALVFHLCYTTLKGRYDDLLIARRTSRVYFVLVIAFVTITAAIIDPLPREVFGFDKRTLKMLTIWPAVLWGTIWLLALNKRSAYFGKFRGSGRDLNKFDDELYGELKHLMEKQEVFKETRISISMLAGQLNITQHRLRSLINDGLGYSNFSAFINAYRVEAVKAAMQSPKGTSLPILTLAMDAGFSSLSTFNKAFKSLEGVTPTEFRKGLKT